MDDSQVTSLSVESPLAAAPPTPAQGFATVSFAVARRQRGRAWLLSLAVHGSIFILALWGLGREGLAQQGYTVATEVAEKYPHSHVAHVIATGAHALQGSTDVTLRFMAYDRAVRQVVLATRATFRKGLGLLATVGSTAPFVGLFGTVIGIVNAFQRMAVTGQGGLGVVSAGIAEALVTTAFGIFVAIPAVWLFNCLTQQISALTTEMECAAEELAVLALGESQAVEARPLHAAKK